MLRNPNAPKNLKFPKVLPPIAQPDGPVDSGKAVVIADEKKEKSQTPEREKDKKRSRYDRYRVLSIFIIYNQKLIWFF